MADASIDSGPERDRRSMQGLVVGLGIALLALAIVLALVLLNRPTSPACQDSELVLRTSSIQVHDCALQPQWEPQQ